MVEAVVRAAHVEHVRRGCRPSEPGEVAQQLLPDLLAGTMHPRRCLLHHAGELQVALVDLKDAQVLVDVGPRGLERADRVWGADVNTS